MKKIISLLMVILVSGFLSVPIANAYAIFLVTKGPSVKGSTMITYAADSHQLYGELYYSPARDYPQGRYG